MISWGTVPSGSVLPFVFGSYDGTTGASEAISGLAVTDIECYKGTSMTQRSSDAGFVLLDTDGIDIDGIVGINGFSIDTGDNTDAGFFAVGSFFTVVVASITADGQTVNFTAGTFRLGPAESVAGYPKADVSHLGGDAQSLADLKDFADAGYDPATNSVEIVKLVNVLTTYTGNTVQTGDGYAILNSGTHGLAALKTLIDAIDNFIDSEIAAVIAAIGTPSDLGGGATLAANLADIEAQTDDIGAAGAGLTAINLPDQTMNITGNITGNLSGSVGSVSGAVGSVTGAVGSVTGAVGSVTGAVGSVTGNVGGNVVGSVGSVGAGGIAASSLAAGAFDAAALAADAAAEIAAALLDLANGIETGYTLRQAQRIMLSVLAGKLSGAATTTVVIRNVTDAKDRVTATVDADGNRSAVILDAT